MKSKTRRTSGGPGPGFGIGGALLVGAAVGTLACAGSGPPGPLRAVEGQIAAFNAHDPGALAEGVAPDFVWLGVEGEELRVEARGREGLREGMASYFEAVPGVASTVEAAVTAGRFVAIRERVRWEGPDGEPWSQSALGVYEVVDDRVVRVWYFPSDG